MRRHCDGNDPELFRAAHEPVALCPDPEAPLGLSSHIRTCAHYRPCQCGARFDDEKFSTTYPHPAIHTERKS